MSKSQNIIVRVEPDLKLKAETILKDLGMNMTDAINIYLSQIVLNSGIPFKVERPKNDTYDYVYNEDNRRFKHG